MITEEKLIIRPRRKRIEAMVEKGPNYIFHLMAVARAGFASPYAEIYHSTVEPDDLTLLENWGKRLVAADGHAAELSPAGVFLPAFLGLGSTTAFAEYFSLLDQALASNPQPFLDRYSTAFAQTSDWIETVDDEWLSAQTPQRANFRRLGSIYERNFAAYESAVWPDERPGMDEVAARLNMHFGAGPGRDTITRWEKLTGLHFRANVYQILLVRAIENGPNANSVGYDRTVFFSGSDPGWMVQFISHETGTHLLIGIFKEKLADLRRGKARWDFGLLYRAYENLARFYNTLILGTPDIYSMSPYYDGECFSEIYRAIYEREPDLTPRDLLERGIERYCSIGA